MRFVLFQVIFDIKRKVHVIDVFEPRIFWMIYSVILWMFTIDSSL